MAIAQQWQKAGMDPDLAFFQDAPKKSPSILRFKVPKKVFACDCKFYENARN